ncbi:hypothetical protein JOF53_002869 [Crossiella equi]|uniref:Uncharacterized protein n=1 Tax=Crossiella equi TaxID=130796 RepID=A0ABS5ACH1_9PSEU|nr:hypothetical protein [Crossiella equi]MBP2473997.1 hypothetical protein [Crossiella equi]
MIWLHEVRRCLPSPALLPLAITAGAFGYALVAAQAAQPGVAVLPVGAVVPVAAGLAASALVSGERLRELHRTVATEFRHTMRRRFLILAVLVSACACLLSAGLAAAGLVLPPQGVLTASLLMLAVGAVAATWFSGAPSASVAVLVCWVLVVVAVRPWSGDWGASALTVLAAAGLFLVNDRTMARETR